MPLSFNPRSAFPAIMAAIVSIGCQPAVSGAEASFDVSGLKIRSASGQFQFGGIDFSAGHFDLSWMAITQHEALVEAGYPEESPAHWETKAALPVGPNGATLELQESLERAGADTVQAGFEASSTTGIPTAEMYLRAGLPIDRFAGKTILIDGTPLELPVQFKDARVFGDSKTSPHTLSLPGTNGTVTLSGTFSLLVQDERQWKGDTYSIRIRFSPEEKMLTHAALAVSLHYAPWQSEPVSLRGVANRGFRDDVAGDGKGGWTDQGPANDISSLKPGKLNAGVVFDIIDPSANQGNSALVLGGSPLPKDIVIPVPGHPLWQSLCLLHAAAWLPPSGSPVGSLTVRYADGTQDRHDIISGRDVGNWWNPSPLRNGMIGWSGENASSPIGLYVSKFALQPKPVKEIALEVTGSAMWMVTGLTGSPDGIQLFNALIPWTVKAGRNWAPYAHSLDTEPDSVFDFSFLADGPAGKYGPLRATKDGHFEFKDRCGVRVRFWGVNVVSDANFLSGEQADKLAERLSRMGYNCVRLHHYDGPLKPPGGPLDAAKLDQLDYLFAALKKRGIYIAIDLYSTRQFSAEELASLGLDPGAKVEDFRQIIKMMVPVSEKAFGLWSEFAAALLTHRNPYTGLTWAEDPALVGICPINEDTLSGYMDVTPSLRELYKKAFAQWRAKHENKAVAADDSVAAFNRFFYDRQADAEKRMADFLRGLGVKALITGTNLKESQGLAFARERYDYVDAHRYWDHPEFIGKPWQLPFRFSQGSDARAFAYAPRTLMPARILGKPFVVTEFHFTRPNQFRAEGGVLMPAYASLQDWDGLYNFEFASSPEAFDGGVGGTFSIATDPIGLISDRVSALIFRRGDIAPASGVVGYAVDSATAFTPPTQSLGENPFPQGFSRIGLIARIGSAVGTPKDILAKYALAAVVADNPAKDSSESRIFAPGEDLPWRLAQDGVLPHESTDASGQWFASDTGQILLRADEGAMKVVAPRCELFVLPPGQHLNGQCVEVENGEAFGTVSVVSLDDHPIAESRRLLVAHLTDALPSGMEFASEDRRILESRGQAPILVSRGSATLILRLAKGGDYQAWAVNAQGARVREIPLERTDGALQLHLETITPEGTQLAYEILRR